MASLAEDGFATECLSWYVILLLPPPINEFIYLIIAKFHFLSSLWFKYWCCRTDLIGSERPGGSNSRTNILHTDDELHWFLGGLLLHWFSA